MLGPLDRRVVLVEEGIGDAADNCRRDNER
nr:MAG TPA: hypothetical protein [Bacteriophage sp.]